MQQAFVDYRRRQWSPSWRWHRVLLTYWQRAAVVADPAFGVAATLQRLLGAAAAPWRSYVDFHADRSGDVDFSQVDQAAATRNFVVALREDLREHPAQPSTAWLAGLQPVAAWIDAIRQRGGSVIFLRTPTTGEHRALEDAAYPDAQYWNMLGAATDAPALESDAVPDLVALKLPDGSHVDMHDKPAYTRALAAALLARGWLQP